MAITATGDRAFHGVTLFQSFSFENMFQSTLQVCRTANNKDRLFSIYRKEHQLKKKREAFEKEGRAGNFCLIIFLISNLTLKGCFSEQQSIFV